MAQTTISVILTQSPTELYKILKFEGLSSSGAEAKIAIANGLVKVNGVIELQKRKKIVDGDVVEFAATTINISCEN
jgi:ribosome-associated protein